MTKEVLGNFICMQVSHFSLTHLAMVDFIAPNLEFAISKLQWIAVQWMPYRKMLGH